MPPRLKKVSTPIMLFFIEDGDCYCENCFPDPTYENSLVSGSSDSLVQCSNCWAYWEDQDLTEDGIRYEARSLADSILSHTAEGLAEPLGSIPAFAEHCNLEHSPFRVEDSWQYFLSNKCELIVENAYRLIPEPEERILNELDALLEGDPLIGKRLERAQNLSRALLELIGAQR